MGLLRRPVTPVRLAFLSLLLALSACAASSSDAPKTPTIEEATGADEELVDYPIRTTPDGTTILEPPFSAEEIRGATPEAMTQFLRMEQGGQRFLIQIAFTEVDDEGALLTNTPIDGKGKPLAEPTSKRVTWAELEKHAWYAAESTTVTDTTVKTVLGTFDALLFTERTEGSPLGEGDSVSGEIVTKSWFAKSLPGSPIRYLQLIDGETAVEMEMVGRSTLEKTSKGD